MLKAPAITATFSLVMALELWLFQVTGMFAEGEGPMGRNSSCVPRQPAAPCF